MPAVICSPVHFFHFLLRKFLRQMTFQVNLLNLKIQYKSITEQNEIKCKKKLVLCEIYFVRNWLQKFKNSHNFIVSYSHNLGHEECTYKALQSLCVKNIKLKIVGCSKSKLFYPQISSKFPYASLAPKSTVLPSVFLFIWTIRNIKYFKHKIVERKVGFCWYLSLKFFV